MNMINFFSIAAELGWSIEFLMYNSVTDASAIKHSFSFFNMFGFETFIIILTI